MNWHLEKILATGGFLFLFLSAIVVASIPPATDYEISIYKAYPSYFWFFLIGGMSCGILILINQAFSERKTNWWIIGLCIIISSNSLFLSLPYFHGYFLYERGDALSHIGWMKDISLMGHISSGNFYPIVHILGTITSQVLDLDFEKVTYMFFALWSSIYLLNVYLLALTISNSYRQALLIMVFGSPLIFSIYHLTLHPSMLSLFMVPLLLFFFHLGQKRQNPIANNFLLVLLGFLITFAHPITCLFVITALSILNLFLYIQQRKLSFSLINPNSQKLKMEYRLPLVMFCAFFIWYSSFAVFEQSVRKVFEFLVYESGMNIVESHTSLLKMSGITVGQTIKLFLYRYGAAAIYCIISFCSAILALRSNWNKKSLPPSPSLIYSVLFFAALLFSAFFIWGFPGGEHTTSIVRYLRFVLMIAPFLCGLTFYELISQDRKKLIGAFLTLLILTVVTLSLLSIYGGPHTVRPNLQVTQMDITGTRFFSTYQNRDIPVATTGVELRRFEDFNFGIEVRPFKRAKLWAELIPSHFGYQEHGTLSEVYTEETYLLISRKNIVDINIYPQNVRPKVHQYNEEDLQRLKIDPSVAQIYNNRGFEVWIVR